MNDGQSHTFEIQVADAGKVSDLNVTLEIFPTRVEDLDVFLESPNGTMVELFSYIGAGSSDIAETKLDDEATVSIDSSFAPFGGTLQPEGLLRNFAGKEI